MKNILIAFATLIFAFAGNAQNHRAPIQSVDLYNIGMLQGRQTVFLKQEILNRYPQLQLQRFQLKSVFVKGISQHGQGQIELSIGGVSVDQKRIYGNPRDFHQENIQAYDNIYLYPGATNTDGPWQLHTFGNIKIYHVSVEIERLHLAPIPAPHQPPRFPQGPLETIQLGGDKADKIGGSAKTFNVENRYVQSITISGESRDVYILFAEVEYADGFRQQIPELQGKLKNGHSFTASLRGAPVRNLTIRAETRELFGSRGKYQISIKAIRF